jgi:excisionase family DNA binding protein
MFRGPTTEFLSLYEKIIRKMMSKELIKMNNQKEEFLTIDEVAKRLKIAKSTVYRMANNGQLPARKIGNVWRFSSLRISELFKSR